MKPNKEEACLEFETKPLTWLGIGDSPYVNEITAKLATKRPTEIALYSAFQINICTFLAILLCNFGLNIISACIYLGCAYVLIGLNAWQQLYRYKKGPHQVNTGISTELKEDSAIAISLPINFMAEQSANPIIALILVMAFLSLQSVISIKPFAGFILSKMTLFFAGVSYVIIIKHQYSSDAAVLFPLTTMFVLMLCVGYWLYIRQVRLLHLTFKQQHLQRMLAEKNLNLDKLNKLREKLVRQIGHDLRQPINSLSYAIFNMKLDRLTDSQKEQIDIASHSISAANYLIEEILRTSIQESDQPVFVHKETFEIGHVLYSLGKEFCPIIQGDNGSLRVVHSSYPVVSDYQIIERILRNFLSNAYTHAKGAKVLLGVRRRDLMLEIQVIDRGPGMPREFLDKACEEFIQGEKSAEQGGLGLGLSIAKSLARAIDGDIVVNSTLGRGTCCSLRIPVTIPVPSFNTSG